MVAVASPLFAKRPASALVRPARAFSKRFVIVRSSFEFEFFSFCLPPQSLHNLDIVAWKCRKKGGLWPTKGLFSDDFGAWPKCRISCPMIAAIQRRFRIGKKSRANSVPPRRFFVPCFRNIPNYSIGSMIVPRRETRRLQSQVIHRFFTSAPTIPGFGHTGATIRQIFQLILNSLFHIRKQLRGADDTRRTIYL